MSVLGPLPTAAQILAHTYYTPTFGGYAWDAGLIHEETDAEKKRRKKHERRAVREIEWKRRKRYAAEALEAVKNVIRNDDKDRSKRNKPLTAPLIPPDPTFHFTSTTWPTVDRTPSPPPPPPPPPYTPLVPAQPIWPVVPITAQGAISPLPRYVDLNPYLAHVCSGHEPITYDIARGPASITYKVNDWTSSPFGPGGLEQPATWPSVTHMNITVVSEDPLPQFSWPLTVSNPFGVTCGDVFNAIWENFHRNVSLHEFYSWLPHRQQLASRAYYRRIGTDLRRPDLVPGTHDGMKRIDYMGGSVMFKGLESVYADTSGGWYLFVGPVNS